MSNRFLCFLSKFRKIIPYANICYAFLSISPFNECVEILSFTAEHTIVFYTSGFNDNERKELYANGGLAKSAVLLPLIIEHKKEDFLSPLSDSCGIQTHNLLIRSQMLYSVELRSRPYRVFFAIASAKVVTSFQTAK